MPSKTTAWRLASVNWELTLRCNLQCLHCGSRAGPASARDRELSFDECVPVLGDLVALGAKRLVFTGGEPFLCGHWEPLARLACRDGLSVQFVSNGLMVDRRLADRLRGLPGVSVGFSLDGHRPKTHDRIRGKPGLHARVLAAIRRLIDRGIPAAVVTTVHRANLAELDGLYELLQGSGIYAWQIQAAMPTGRMAQRPGLALDSSGYLAIARFIARVAREGKLRVATGDNIGYFGPLEAELRDPVWSGCPAGLSTVGIRSNGDITGCLSLQDTPPEGNIRQRRLADIWRDPARFAYNRRFNVRNLKGRCRGCPFGALCRGGCSFLSHSHTGEYHHCPRCLRCQEQRSKESVLLIG